MASLSLPSLCDNSCDFRRSPVCREQHQSHPFALPMPGDPLQEAGCHPPSARPHDDTQFTHTGSASLNLLSGLSGLSG